MELTNSKLRKRDDIIIKRLYAKAFLQDSCELTFYRHLYEKHIWLMTWGIEDNKVSLQDFVNSYENLLTSLRGSWFDSSYPIPINSHNELLNGAHRYAGSLALGITPSYTTHDSVRGISRSFPRDSSVFSLYEKIACLRGVDRLYNAGDILVLRPNNTSDTSLIEQFSKASKEIDVLGRYTLDFGDSDYLFSEFIYELYAFDGHFEWTLWIQKKANMLISFGRKCTIVLTKEKVDKKHLRSVLSEYVPKSVPSDIREYCSFHSAWDTQELQYLKNILLSHTNIRHLMQRKHVWWKRKIYDLLHSTTKVIWEPSTLLVVGSWPMIVMWIQPKDDEIDVDFITEDESNIGIQEIQSSVDHLTSRYHYAWKKNQSLISDKDSFFWRRGFKFLSLPVLLTQKLHGTREKDLLHAEQIREFRDWWTTLKQTALLSYHFQKFLTRQRIYLLTWARWITKKLGVYKFLSFLRIKYFLKKHIKSNRIAFITPNFDPYPLAWWIVEQTKLLSKAFQKKWYNIDIYTFRHEKDRLKTEDSSHGLIIRYAYSLQLLFLILKNSWKYDVIISQTVFRSSAIVSLLQSAKLLFCPSIICLHSGGEDDELIRLQNKLKYSRAQHIYFWLIGNNTVIKALNKDNISHLQQIYQTPIKARIVQVPNWIDFEKSDTPLTQTQSWSLVYMSKITQKKWIFDLIQACKDLPQITLHIAGNWTPEDINKIKKMIKWMPHIHYHGYLAWEKKDQLLCKSECLILPSYHEWAPMVLLEAVTYNMKIITTDVGNTKDIFGSRVSYVRAWNILELQEAIQYQISSPALADDYYAHIQKNCNIETIAESLLSLVYIK